MYMKENVFLKVGYSPFLENKKEKWSKPMKVYPIIFTRYNK